MVALLDPEIGALGDAFVDDGLGTGTQLLAHPRQSRQGRPLGYCDQQSV